MPAYQNNDYMIDSHQSHEELAGLLQLSPLAAFTADTRGDLTAVNTELCELLGYRQRDLIGKTFDSVIEPSESGRRLSDLAPGSGLRLHRADGTIITAEAFARHFPDGSVVFLADATARLAVEAERLESEKKRWQSDRIEALGRLAGGIAHDFNNFLAVLLLHVDILNLHLDAESPIRVRAAEIKEAANSIAATVRQLFAFGRKQPMTLAPSKLNPVIENFAYEFRRTSAGIDVRLKLDEDLGLCFVDQAQVLQILRNLGANANDAMPEGGALTIETSNIQIESGSSDTIQPTGPYIQITVSDTGIGIDPAIEPHIFEPFFSTKESDKGAGLTLAMVYGIVKQSKGFIWVSSEPGKGTTFKVQFPRIDVVQPSDRTIETKADPAHARTVLLVDDEAAVRRVTGEFLQMSGFRVLHAGNGMEALEVAQASFDPIDLLLTDITMPLMDGREVAERITKLHPDAAVIYMSGDANREPDSNGEPTDFISKPFSLAALTEKVLTVLDARKAEAARKLSGFRLRTKSQAAETPDGASD